MRPVVKSLSVCLGLLAVPITGVTAANAQSFWNNYIGGPPYASAKRPPERVRRPDARRDRSDGVRARTAVVPASAATSLSPVSQASTSVAQSAPPSALVAVASLKSQTMTVWGDGGAVLQTRISTGQPGYSTPAGIFSVIQKNRYHESNIYSGAPMPFMQRITWSGIAMHAGVVPNYPASHGCIRLPHDVAQRLFGMTRMGMRVIVTATDTQPFAVDDVHLPQPYLMPTAELAAALETVRGEALLPPIADGNAARTFNPHEVATRLKAEAINASRRKSLTAREALAFAAVKAAEANAAVADLRSRRADLAVAEADARSNALVADTSQTIDRAAAKIAADQRLVEARQFYSIAVAEEALKTPLSFTAARAAREAERTADDAPDQLKEIGRRLEPLSIFVSLKERSVFIRQGFEAVLEASVDIADIDTPIGTHTFTAMAASEDGAKLRWLGLTMPGEQSSARSALERVTLPDHVRDEISRRVWVGASLVISDQGVSNETGRGTDFVVLMK